MASVTANGLTIEYHEQGAGEPLLLVMGLGGQLIDWPQPFVDELAARGFRVIRFDNRDSGLSTLLPGPPPGKRELVKAAALRRAPRADYLLADMARDAVGLLDALRLDDAHVVGISMGGMIAQTMAIEHPARVRSLASIMSTTGNRRVGQPALKVLRTILRRPVPTRSNAIEQAMAFFEQVCGPRFDPAEFRRTAEAAVARSFRPVGTARQAIAVVASGDRTAALRRLRVPTLVVHGLVDPLIKPSGGVATARAIAGSRLVMFNDMGHDLPRTRWIEMADEIAANAARVAQPDTASELLDV